MRKGCGHGEGQPGRLHSLGLAASRRFQADVQERLARRETP
ncbi:MAG: hypothetical protein WC789_09065 [Lentisphaeria bacterium]